VPCGATKYQSQFISSSARCPASLRESGRKGQVPRSLRDGGGDAARQRISAADGAGDGKSERENVEEGEEDEEEVFSGGFVFDFARAWRALQQQEFVVAGPR